MISISPQLHAYLPLSLHDALPILREGGLRVLVEHPHPAVARRAVELIVELLDVLAVVSFGIGQPEQPLLQDRVVLVPQRSEERRVVNEASCPLATGASMQV